MEEIKDIRDDQIRIIGDASPTRTLPRRWGMVIVVVVVLLFIGGIIGWSLYRQKMEVEPFTEAEHIYFVSAEPVEPVVQEWGVSEIDKLAPGYTEIRDTVVNDIPIRIFIPHNAEPSLQLGRVDKGDESIVYVAQAADVSADKGGIVGAFVLKGEPLAWGLSKKGYCAIIDGKVTIGMAKNSPLFEKATETGGYFFRQSPLVSNGKFVFNKPKGKSTRRAICDRRGEIFMVETGTPESFLDFAQALVDLGADQAIYLVGSSAYGWAVDQDGTRHEFGVENDFRGRRGMPKNTSYIVWKRK